MSWERESGTINQYITNRSRLRWRVRCLRSPDSGLILYTGLSRFSSFSKVEQQVNREAGMRKEVEGLLHAGCSYMHVWLGKMVIPPFCLLVCQCLQHLEKGPDKPLSRFTFGMGGWCPWTAHSQILILNVLIMVDLRQLWRPPVDLGHLEEK